MGVSIPINYTTIDTNNKAAIDERKPVFLWTIEDGFTATNNAPSDTALAGDLFGHHIQCDDNSEGASIGAFICPAAGTYTVEIIMAKGTDYGIVGIQLDGGTDVDIDGYNAGGALTNQFETASLGTVTRGLHHVNIRVHSKHASSTDYYLKVQAVAIYLTV